MSERELKFRAWKPETKYSKAKMIFATLIDLLRGIGDDCPDYPAADWDSDAKNIMQYTGLKDKNGKEIYEGDVVQEDWTGNWKSLVYFENACFYINTSKIEQGVYQKQMIYYALDKNLEVIGNIHENPDLMGGA